MEGAVDVSLADLLQHIEGVQLRIDGASIRRIPVSRTSCHTRSFVDVVALHQNTGYAVVLEELNPQSLYLREWRDVIRVLVVLQIQIELKIADAVECQVVDSPIDGPCVDRHVPWICESEIGYEVLGDRSVTRRFVDRHLEGAVRGNRLVQGAVRRLAHGEGVGCTEHGGLIRSVLDCGPAEPGTS